MTNLMTEFDRVTRNGEWSLWARATGLAEGTRTKEGGYTEAAWGHADPVAQGRTNYGSFSWDVKGTGKPWMVDRQYIQENFGPAFQAMGPWENRSVVASLELLVALDVWVQSPQALSGWEDEISTGMGFCRHYSPVPEGYPVSLSALVDARVNAYRNTQGKLETGFATEALLRQDQERRTQAILTSLRNP